MAQHLNQDLKKNKRRHLSNNKTANRSTEALKATIEKKKLCNSKALEIVIRFSEGTISESCLLENLQYINQEHYQDIVEERAINKWCGYPLCSNRLKSIPEKRYHISTTHNKVFDITDRKNYCSNLCYKASKYLKDQISTSPIWLRENLTPTAYLLISLNSKCGLAGDQVDFGVQTVKLEDLATSNITEESTHKTGMMGNDSHLCIHNSDIVAGNGERHDVQDGYCDKFGEHSYPKQFESDKLTENVSHINPIQNMKKTEEQSHDKDILSVQFSVLSHNESKGVTSNTIIEENILETPVQNKKSANDNLVLDKNNEISQPTIVIKSKFNDNKDNLRNSKTNLMVPNKSTNIEDIRKSSNIVSHNHIEQKNKNDSVQMLVMNVEKVLKEWFSIDSLFYIFGEERVKEILKEKSNSISNFKSNTTTSEQANLYERYLAICKKLNILELEDTTADVPFKDKIKKPLPNYETLKEEAKQMDLKVRMFYKGDKMVNFEDSLKINDEREYKEEPVLPLVDLHAQKSLRKRIVIEKLRKGLQDLQKSLGLKNFNLGEDLRTLLSTFILSAHNITMKPAEWTLITIFMIKLLSIQNPVLGNALNTNPTKNHLTLLLMSYTLDEGYLDRLIEWLIDIESILKNKS